MSISKEISDEIALYNLSKEEKVDYETLLQVLQFAFTKLNSFKCTLDQLYEYLPEHEEINQSEYSYLVDQRMTDFRIENYKAYLFALVGIYEGRRLNGWLHVVREYPLLKRLIINVNQSLKDNLLDICKYINNEYSPNIKADPDKLLQPLERVEEVVLTFIERNKIKLGEISGYA